MSVMPYLFPKNSLLERLEYVRKFSISSAQRELLLLKYLTVLVYTVGSMFQYKKRSNNSCYETPKHIL